jgi:hypothetical protein
MNFRDSAESIQLISFTNYMHFAGFAVDAYFVSYNSVDAIY